MSRSDAQSGGFVYGYHPVREVLRHRPHSAAEVLVSRRRGGKRLAEIEALTRRHGIALREVGEANELRKVVFHTIAIGEFQKTFMQRLAQESGGTFIDLGR